MGLPGRRGRGRGAQYQELVAQICATKPRGAARRPGDRWRRGRVGFQIRPFPELTKDVLAAIRKELSNEISALELKEADYIEAIHG
jgi:hypothetical protein